jgi:excinuclease ABC subunit B
MDTEKRKLDETRVGLLTASQLENRIIETRKEMEKSAKNLDFLEAAKYRDLLAQLQKAKKN